MKTGLPSIKVIGPEQWFQLYYTQKAARFLAAGRTVHGRKRRNLVLGITAETPAEYQRKRRVLLQKMARFKARKAKRMSQKNVAINPSLN